MKRFRKTAIVFGGLVGVAAGAAIYKKIRGEVEEVLEEIELAEGVSFEVETEDGALIDGVVCGEGPTVVLSHGWTDRRLIWVPLATRLLDRGYQVVLYDQRGHGHSTMGEAPPTIDVLGDDLRAVLEEADAKDAVVVGHSMGGMATQALAIGHPDVVADRVKALVLVSTGAARVAGAPIGRISRVVCGSAVVERLLNTRVGLTVIRPVAGKTIPRAHLTATRDRFTGMTAAARVGWLRAMQDMDLIEGLADVAVPTTVVVGGRDLLTPVYLAKSIVANLPGAQLVRVPGAGHMLPYERPDLLATVVAEALEAGVSGRTARPTELEEEGLATAGAGEDLTVSEHESDLDEPDAVPSEPQGSGGETRDLVSASG